MERSSIVDEEDILVSVSEQVRLYHHGIGRRDLGAQRGRWLREKAMPNMTYKDQRILADVVIWVSANFSCVHN